MAVTSGHRRRRAKVDALVILAKKLLAFLFSHVGLCALMMAYTMLGSVLFRAIEGTHERDIHQYVRRSRSRALTGIWKSTFAYNVKLDIWESNVSSELIEFKWALLRIIQKGYDANDQEDNTQWTFSGAFLYSLSVITTIGYGNIACRTAFGKAMTIVYAILGIPLMLLFLTNIGDVLAKIFKFLYRKTVRLRMHLEMWNKKRKFRRSPRANSLISATKAIQKAQSQQRLLASPLLQHQIHQPDHRRKSTGQTGAISKTKDSRRLGRMSVYASLREDSRHRLSAGSTGIRTGLDRILDFYRIMQLLHNSEDAYERISIPTIHPGIEEDLSMEQIRLETFAQRYETDQVSFRDSMDEKLSKLTVPLWLVFSTMLAYLMAGATMFHVWEGWSFFNSFYFCYVSLATIGFGDLFPGTSIKDAGSQEKLIITSLYLMLGMALIAMCFNLAQEEVVNKMTRVAGKLGIVQSSDQDVSVYEPD